MNFQAERRPDLRPERLLPPLPVQLPGGGVRGRGDAQVAPPHHGHRVQPRRPTDARLILVRPRLRLRPVPGMDCSSLPLLGGQILSLNMYNMI